MQCSGRTEEIKHIEKFCFGATVQSLVYSNLNQKDSLEQGISLAQLSKAGSDAISLKVLQVLTMCIFF